METTLAILLVLGIFIGIPTVIGFGIVGALRLAERLRGTAVRQAGRAETQVAGAQPVATARR